MGRPTILRGDNQSSIMAATNPGQHRSQLRHLELHAWAVRDLVREGQVQGLEWVSTEENPSDLLTKAIASPSKFAKFQAVLLGEQKATACATALVAKSAARDELRKRGSGAGTVFLRAGTYFLSETFELDERDTGTMYAAYEQEPVIISGATRVMAEELNWQRHGQDGILVTDFPASIEAVPALFLNGSHQWPARWPNGDPTLGPQYNSSATSNPLIPAGWGKAIQSIAPNVTGVNRTIKSKNVAYNGRNYSIVRNVTGVGSSKNGEFHWNVGGPSLSRFNPPSSFWSSSVPAGIRVPEDVIGRLSGSLDSAVVHTNAWPSTWGGTWAYTLDSISNDTLWFGAGGHQEARGRDNVQLIYYVEGVLSLLDNPGEFFWDKAAHKLYLMPNASTVTDLSQLPVLVPRLTTLVRIAKSDDLLCVRRDPNHYQSIFRGGAFVVQDAEQVTIQRCRFADNLGNGLLFSNHVVNSTVAGNEFIRVYSGWPPKPGRSPGDATEPTYPDRNVVTLNHIHEVGLTGKGTAGYFHSLASSSEIRANVLYNGPRAGIDFNDGAFGGHHVSDNLLFGWSRETGGHSPFNAWDRVSYLTMHGDQPSQYPLWSSIERNLIFSFAFSRGNTPNCDWCLDWDDGASYFLAHDNVCVYGNFKTHGSGAKYVYRNWLLYPDTPVDGHACVTAQSHGIAGEIFFNNTCQLAGNKHANLLEQGGCSGADAVHNPDCVVPGLMPSPRMCSCRVSVLL
eukprot:g736.t1